MTFTDAKASGRRAKLANVTLSQLTQEEKDVLIRGM